MTLPLALLYPIYIHNLGNGGDIVYDVQTNVGLVSFFLFLFLNSSRAWIFDCVYVFDSIGSIYHSS